MSDVSILNGQEFESQVVSSDQVTLVDFYADWCGPCKMVAPVLEQLKEDFEGKAQVVKLDADAEPNVLAKYGVRGLPTLMVFKNGEPVDVTVGAQPYSSLKALLDKHV